MATVKEDESHGTVTIDGKTIVGFVDEQRCATCTTERVYYDSFDAYFCPSCNVWLEHGCSGSSCDYCRDRPTAPMTAVAGTSERAS